MAFFFNDTATTEIYTLSLHDALPISVARVSNPCERCGTRHTASLELPPTSSCPSCTLCLRGQRSEEHTSELQSRQYLVCRLLLEKKQLRAADSNSTDPISPHLTVSAA